ncbi:MAG: cadmium-translocating P-type ATPase [Thermoproteales archaeon]|nr:cadmium-translocating P-type ATPase [Thermoproteales archaeon]
MSLNNHSVCEKCNIVRNQDIHEDVSKVSFITDEDLREVYRLSTSGFFWLLGIILLYYGLNEMFVSLFFIASYLTSGYKVIISALKKILTKDIFNENFLLLVASMGAFYLGQFPEGSGVMLFFCIGEFLQETALKKSRRTIESLLSLKSDTVNLKIQGKIVEAKPESVDVGDIIVIRPGEKIPLDGVVVKGRSILDVSMLTGESAPREVDVGDKVLSGMINVSSLLEIKVMKRLEESTVTKILNLIQEAIERKSRNEKFITRFAKVYTPVIIFMALLVAVVPPLFLGESFRIWFYRSLTLLIIACPCALVLSIPLGYFAGIGKAAREGILVKGSNFLDLLVRAKIFVFDKTGTLTSGILGIGRVVSKSNYDEREVLRIAAIAERYSSHPIAKTIREAYDDKIDLDIREYVEFPGFGVKMKLKDVEVMVGSDKLLHREKIAHDVCEIPGSSIVHVVVNDKHIGFIELENKVKNEAVYLIDELKRFGVKKTIMLTGDDEEVARRVAKILGIDEFYARLLPQEKVEVLEDIKKRYNEWIVAYVGDGINDAPVIARADVGIAMGAMGSDAAIEVADVVVMDDNLSRISRAIQISRKTKSVVIQNIVFSILVKIIFLSLGVIGEASMWEALIADTGVALLTILNSLRILR